MMYLYRLGLTSFIITFGMLSFVSPIYAQLNTGVGDGGLASGIAQEAGFSETDQFTLSLIIGTIVQFLFGFLGIAFTILVVYSGYNWMTAQGESEKVEKAQNTIQQAIIGMVICFSGYAISNFVIKAFIG